jgi:cell pole-organizing protein PopZ
MPLLENPRHEQFAQRVAAGATAVAAYVAAGYSESGAAQSAARLLKNAQVRARVQEIHAAISERLTDCSIRQVDARVRALQDRWDKMNRIIAARSADPDIRKAPGGETGLLVRTLKQLGRGETAEIVEEFELDTGLLKELREHEKQAAQELGQWTDRTEHTGEVTLIEQRLKAARERLQKQ